MKLDIGLSYEDSLELVLNKLESVKVLCSLLEAYSEYDTYCMSDKEYHIFYYGVYCSISVVYYSKDKKLKDIEYTVYDSGEIKHLTTESFSEALKYIKYIEESL